MMRRYYRPLPQSGPARPQNAITLAGGWTWFTHVEVLARNTAPEILPCAAVPRDVMDKLQSHRPAIAGLTFDRPRVMGILNVTPDSFSDGGQHHRLEDALAGAANMEAADILDIGGESTRPGAQFVPPEEEIARTAPVIAALRAEGIDTPVSIDTRKAAVAASALKSGADIINDVSGFTFDKDLGPLAAHQNTPVCVMHAQGDPATMQDAPSYDDVVLDVFDFLERRIEWLESIGVSRSRIIADPGIGFGKTLEHNLALLARLSVFHALGVPILLGASRKRFIGTLGGAEVAADRVPGSLAVALASLKQGTQIVRVHDVPETVQAIALWQAVVAGHTHG